MADDHEKRYRDLPPEVRALLEQGSAAFVADLLRLQRLGRECSDEAITFLCRADPETLKWLQAARPEEINQLNEGLQLVRSFRSVGRFMKWVLAAIAGIFITTFMLAEHAQKWFKGIGR